MDTSLSNRKNGIFEVAKTISKSNLFEKKLENNKPIKVQIKTKNDLIYHDLTPNKERTKKIMSSFLKPNQNKISHHRVNSDTLSNNNNFHKIQKIISINNKIKNGIKANFEKEINNSHKNSSNNKNKDINGLINNNNLNENEKNNIYNQINVNTNNLYSLNYENDNIDKIKKINTLYKNSIFNDSKRMFETIENSFMKDNKSLNSNDDNKEHLNTITANRNYNSINKTSLNNGKQLKKNIITKRIILTQSESNLNVTNKSQNKSFINNLTENNVTSKKSHLKKSNSTFLSRNNNNTISNEEMLKENNNPITILKIEDLIVLEEKLSKILESFKNISQLKTLCVEWYNYYTYCSFYNVFEDFFTESQYNEKTIAHEYTILEFLSIITLHEVLKDKNISQSTLNYLQKLIVCVYQNFLFACDYIISILPVIAQKRSWVEKLQNILNNKNEIKIMKNEHLSCLRIGNNNISILMKTILRLYSNNNSIINGNELLFYLSRSTRIYISTLNEYFKKKIYLDENNINSEDNNLNLENHQTKKNGISNLRNKINLPKKDIKKIFTLVLDLDETIISYNNETKTFIPRPGLNKFLNEISKIYEIILFTSAKQEYADSIIDQIDKNKIYFEKRFYRQHNLIINNSFIKDLSRLKKDLSKVIFLDNKPQSYGLQIDNEIFIKSFHGDEKFDNVLIYLIPILKKIASNPSNDVRKEIKKMKNEIYSKISTDLNNECQ
jgi:Dullard-like phosphatase family protein